jgi:membrane fusion protein (multidrug efflux system)
MLLIILAQARQLKGRRQSVQPQSNYRRLLVSGRQGTSHRWIGFLSLAVLSILTACSDKKNAQTSQVTVAPTVVVTSVQPQTVPIYSEYVGQTEAANTVEIHAQVQGFLQQISFKEGSAVNKGQLLFVIDPRPYQAVLQQAKATLEVQQATVNNAQKIVDRYTPLAQQHALSEQQLDSAVATAKENQAQVQSAEAQVDAAQLNVNYTRIRAPMAGSIGTAQVKVGDLVQSGTTQMATIYSISPMYVRFAITQNDYLSYVKRRSQHPKQSHPIQLILGNGSVYGQSGTVNMVAPTVDTSTGTLSIRATFLNPQGVLKPGLFARVRFVTRDAVNALLVPQSAVQQLQGTESVFVVGADNKVQQRTIKTGATVGTLEIVSSGLQPGDRVIVEGTQKAQPGLVVKVQEAPQQPLPATTTAAPVSSGTSGSPQPQGTTPASSSTATKPKED